MELWGPIFLCVSFLALLELGASLPPPFTLLEGAPNYVLSLVYMSGRVCAYMTSQVCRVFIPCRYLLRAMT